MKICLICNKEFEEKHFNQHYCCLDCKYKAKRNSQEKYKKTEKGKASRLKWVNSERFKSNEKVYRQKPRARHLAVLRAKRFFKKRPDLKKHYDKVYGYSRRGYNAGKLDKIAWENKLKELNGECQMCGTKENITIDHIKPLSLGGNNHIDNLQPLCNRCNAKKGNRL